MGRELSCCFVAELEFTNSVFLFYMENVVIISRSEFEDAIYQGINRYVSEHMFQHSDTSQEEYLSSTEMCQRLRISSTTLWRYEAAGIISPIKIGRKKLYPIQNINKVLASNLVK